jgi:hypothetical protein
MAFSEFLNNLFAAGRVAVPEPSELSAQEIQDGLRVLQEYEADWRMEMPGQAPPFDRNAASWAATQFYEACQLTVFRDLGVDRIAALRISESQHGESVSVHYSVDLTFRYLPDLIQLARATAGDDPLVELLLQWACLWPLSSVGVVGVQNVDIRPLVTSSSLLGLYVDRIIARGDSARLTTNEQVRAAVQTALGLYPCLAPKLSAAICGEHEADS